MKFRPDSKKYISIVLLLLIVGSTAAYSIMQSFGWGGGATYKQVELPANNVIDYELTAAQKDYAARSGKTLLEYRYPMMCANCTEHKAYLEFFVSKFPDQLLLQEISDNSVSRPSLDVTSYYGSRTLTDPSVDGMFGALCDTMVQPPVSCATRNVK
ncbi:MAG: hypothetical protein ABIA12_02430 [Candidatus Aenigmatarchaeota archaeon]